MYRWTSFRVSIRGQSSFSAGGLHRPLPHSGPSPIFHRSPHFPVSICPSRRPGACKDSCGGSSVGETRWCQAPSGAVRGGAWCDSRWRQLLFAPGLGGSSSLSLSSCTKNKRLPQTPVGGSPCPLSALHSAVDWGAGVLGRSSWVRPVGLWGPCPPVCCAGWGTELRGEGGPWWRPFVARQPGSGCICVAWPSGAT